MMAFVTKMAKSLKLRKIRKALLARGDKFSLKGKELWFSDGYTEGNVELDMYTVPALTLKSSKPKDMVSVSFGTMSCSSFDASMPFNDLIDSLYQAVNRLDRGEQVLCQACYTLPVQHADHPTPSAKQRGVHGGATE